MTSHDPFDFDKLADSFSDLSNLPAPDAHLTDPDVAALSGFDGPSGDEGVADLADLDDDPVGHQPAPPGADDGFDDDVLDGDLDDAADDDSVRSGFDLAAGDDAEDGPVDMGSPVAENGFVLDVGPAVEQGPLSAFGDVVADVWGLDVEPFAHPLVPDEGWELHQMAVHLEGAGVDATVAHDDLEGLADRIDAGATVFLTVDTAEGPVAMRIVEVRWDDDLMVLETLDGVRGATLDLDRFEDDWAETANQLLVAEPPRSDDVIVLHTGDFVAVPVHVPDELLEPLPRGGDR